MNDTTKYQITAELLSDLESERYNIGVGEHLQIQTLLKNLPDNSTADDLKFVLIPLIAKNKIDQDRLYAVFEQMAKSSQLIAQGSKSPTFWQTVISFINQNKIAIALTLLVICLPIWFMYLQYKNKTRQDSTDKIKIEQPNTTQNQKGITQNPKTESPFVENKPYPFPNHLEDYSYKSPSVTREWLQNNWWWFRYLLAFVFCLLLFGVWWYLARRNRKLVAQQNQNDKPPYFWNINLEGVDKDVFDTQSIEQLATQLRHRSEADKFRMDIDKTINATIAQGGSPIFVYKTETSPTDYVLLIDRQSVRNHRARLFDELYEALKAQEVEITRFFYDSDVRVCFNETYPNGISISDIQQRYYTARLMLIGTGAQLLSPLSGKLAKWTDIFDQFRHRALFSPRPLKVWGFDEKQLANLFTTLPATLESLNYWIEAIDAGAEIQRDAWQTKISDAPNASIVPDEASPIPILQVYFDNDVIEWIAACAIYPSLHFDLTLWFGQQLSTHNKKLSTYLNLTQIFRLSWFVQGEMPKETRAALLSWLEQRDATQLLNLRAALAAELGKNPPAKDSVAFEQFRMNMALNEWLSSTDKKKKKELEQEIAQNLANGVEADFTVIKYLQKPKTPLDFIVPKAWKKFVHPGGYSALGWLKEWKILGWLLPLGILGPIAIIRYDIGVTTSCSKDNRVLYVNTNPELGQLKTYYFCLDDVKQHVVYFENTLRDTINHGNYAHADSLITNFGTKQLAPEDTTHDTIWRESMQNIAVDFYKTAKSLYQRGLKDSACFYLNIAAQLNDSDNDIRNAIQLTCRDTTSGGLDKSTKPVKQINTPQNPAISPSGTFSPDPGKDFDVNKQNIVPVVTNTPKPALQTIVQSNRPDTVQNSVNSGNADTFVLENTKLNDTIINKTINLDMVYVQGGTFTMGSKDDDKEADAEEKPAHKVTLNDFYIGKTEVTQAQWRAIMGSDPPELSFKGCDNCPVESVSWDDIQEFMKKLNAKSKNQYRLPTEAEWEFAARGGTKSKNYIYSGSNNVDEVAWHDTHSGNKTHTVGKLLPNELGI